mmetsp:Transcript_97538/g.260301  ORF Transcript_97538/g.260301 Transcript_97538/m.260301 type:complete len:262 (+) Transcript_97538:224-1009(+)
MATTFASQHTQKKDKLRGALIAVGEKFIGFDKVVEDDALQRKVVEQKRMQDITEGMAKLEKALNSEIKRRVEANKTLQQMTEQIANDMLDRLQKRILQRIESITGGVQNLTSRCATLERGIQQFKGELPSKLQVDTAALVREIAELKLGMEGDKKLRIERDTQYLKRLADVELGIDGKFDDEFRILEEQTRTLKAEVEALSRADDGSEEQFRSFILEEVSALKNGLALASQAREQTDDEIVQALNQYTNALQKGLRQANMR